MPDVTPTTSRARRSPRAARRGRDDQAREAAPATVDRIVESLVYLYAEGRRRHAEHSSTFGLTPSQLTVLNILHGLGGELRTSAIGDRMRAHSSTVTGIVDRMVRDGWVERVNDEHDRRVIRVRLTARGRDLARRIPSTATDLLRRAVGRLPAQDQRQLLRIFAKLATELTAEVDALDEP